MLDKIFSKKVVVPFFQILGIVAIFQWIVFPGLTTADTLLNIISVIIGFFTLLALYYVVSPYFITDKSNELSDEETKQMLESEIGPVIDEMAKEVLAKPKKKNPKQSVPKGVDETQPFVKTRKKPATKKTK